MLALGIATGAVFRGLAAMVGLHLIFDAALSLLWAPKIGGAVCLMSMARHLWRDAEKPFIAEDARPVPRSSLGAFRLGLWINLSNPKAVVIHASIFPGTVSPGTPARVPVCPILVILAAETAWNSLVARLFSLDRTRAAHISLKTVIDCCFGAALARIGVKIVATWEGEPCPPNACRMKKGFTSAGTRSTAMPGRWPGGWTARVRARTAPGRPWSASHAAGWCRR